MEVESSSGKIIRRIIFVSIIVIGMLAMGVFATKTDINYVTIKFSDDTSISVMTTKTNVSEILEENNIVLLEDEEVVPSLDSDINVSKTIEINKVNSEEVVVAEEISSITTEEILGNYVTVTEKIITEQVEIPYETVTKDISVSGTETQDTVLQQGENGLKEVKYKVKYQDEEEVERTVISEEVIKEPVDKIVQVSSKVVSRSSTTSASVTECQAYAKKRCSDYGWSDSDFSCLVTLWNKESGWRVNATSSSGAYGIPQALPASKMASFGSDYLTNYETQINWGLNYIKNRYGTPTKALSHFNATGWY